MAGTESVDAGGVYYVSEGVVLILPLPDDLNFDTDYNWTSYDGGLVALLAEAYQEHGIEGAGKYLASNAKDIVMRLLSQSEEAQALQQKFGGKITNPMSEILFRGVSQREFTMEFSITYKTGAEMAEFISNLNDLYKSAAPEFTEGKTFLKVPARGDLYVQGADGQNIIKPRTVQIKKIGTDLTPDQILGTFNNGMPLHVKLAITFIELEIPNKESDEKIFYAGE